MISLYEVEAGALSSMEGKLLTISTDKAKIILELQKEIATALGGVVRYILVLLLVDSLNLVWVADILECLIITSSICSVKESAPSESNYPNILVMDKARMDAALTQVNISQTGA